jgi:hypothetical protein
MFMTVVSAQAEKPFNFVKNTLFLILRAGKKEAKTGNAPVGRERLKNENIEVAGTWESPASCPGAAADEIR